MTTNIELLYFASALVPISCVLFWHWKRTSLNRQKNEYRKNAYDRLVGYAFRSDYPEYEFSGENATVVLRKEEFFPKDEQLAGKFIYLCRNAFDEYFFCVIDISLSAIHIPKERALLFLKDFPNEYAAEMTYLSSR